MNKSLISNLVYSLFFIFGHSGSNDANAQNSELNSNTYSYYDASAVVEINYADCTLDAANQARVQQMRDTINGY